MQVFTQGVEQARPVVDIQAAALTIDYEGDMAFVSG
ncbi:hypothetical protein L901_19220 [Agrobacterium sp. D14]|nr:hypothetical protein L901_19220 [Agrobacterium sp. D14]